MRIIKIIQSNLQTTNKRSSLILKNVFYGFGIRGINILVSLILVPLTINYVNSELYGVWLTLASMTQWLGFFDIGLGNGLRNNLAKAIALKHYKLGSIYVSSTYFILFLIFLSLGVVIYFLAPYVNWAHLLSVSNEMNGILIDMVRIMGCAFCVQFVLRLISNVSQSYQLNALSSAFDSCGNLLSLIFVYVLTKTTFPDLRYLAIVFCGAPIIVNIIASFILYSTKFKEVAPSIRLVSAKSMKSIANLGGLFFLIQIVYIVLFQSTNFIISHICGPEQVTVYNIAYKYLTTALMILQIILAPIWTAFTDAFTNKDYPWMLNIYHKLIRIWTITALFVGMLVLLSPWVYQIWVGDSVSIPFVISVFVGIYVVLTSFTNIHSIIINGIGAIKMQLIQSIIQVIIYIPLAYFTGKLFGLIGVVLSLCVVMIIPAGILFKQTNLLLNQQAKGIWCQ